MKVDDLRKAFGLVEKGQGCLNCKHCERLVAWKIHKALVHYGCHGKGKRFVLSKDRMQDICEHFSRIDRKP